MPLHFNVAFRTFIGSAKYCKGLEVLANCATKAVMAFCYIMQNNSSFRAPTYQKFLNPPLNSYHKLPAASLDFEAFEVAKIK